MIIRELISSIKAGWHSGKGHKATKLGKYERALRHYEFAVEYQKLTGKYGSGPNPVSLECIRLVLVVLGSDQDNWLILWMKTQKMASF